MNPAEYTPDSISRSMGLGEFADHGEALPSLRVLLCPSFAPEVCLTLRPKGDITRLRIDAAHTQIWHLPSSSTVTTYCEDILLPHPFDLIDERFRNMLAERRHMVAMIDGMQAHFSLKVAQSGVIAHEAISGPSADFVAFLVKAAFQEAKLVKCRNALAKVGSYAGLKLPIETVPDDEVTTRLMVLGPNEDRVEFLAAVVKVSRRDREED